AGRLGNTVVTAVHVSLRIRTDPDTGTRSTCRSATQLVAVCVDRVRDTVRITDDRRRARPRIDPVAAAVDPRTGAGGLGNTVVTAIHVILRICTHPDTGTRPICRSATQLVAVCVDGVRDTVRITDDRRRARPRIDPVAAAVDPRTGAGRLGNTVVTAKHVDLGICTY